MAEANKNDDDETDVPKENEDRINAETSQKLM